MKENKIYCAEGDPDYGCIYIAAKNGKAAKEYALGTWVAEHLDNPYIQLRITRKWNVKKTNYEGELDIFQINELGLAWWACANCESEDFEILSGKTYKCKKCGKEYDIPYIG